MNQSWFCYVSGKNRNIFSENLSIISTYFVVEDPNPCKFRISHLNSHDSEYIMLIGVLAARYSPYTVISQNRYNHSQEQYLQLVRAVTWQDSSWNTCTLLSIVAARKLWLYSRSLSDWRTTHGGMIQDIFIQITSSSIIIDYILYQCMIYYDINVVITCIINIIIFY